MNKEITKELLRKGVSGFILNKKGELLLVNLHSFETKFYTIPGGGIDQGETLEDAVYREIREELGITKVSLNFTGICKDSIKLIFKTIKLQRDGVVYTGMERFCFGFHFTGNDTEIILQAEEVRAFKWVAIKDLADYLLFDNQLEDTTSKLLELFPSLNEKK